MMETILASLRSIDKIWGRVGRLTGSHDNALLTSLQNIGGCCVCVGTGSDSPGQEVTAQDRK